VSPAGVPAAIAAVLLVQHGGHDVESRLVQSLRPLDALLVLDNCERVAGVVARLAERIVAAAPRVDILATSRSDLGADGEHRIVVAPLPEPEPGDADAPAIRLFVDRMSSARPGFVPTGPDLAVVARICRRLDRLPLAIELAAARGRRRSLAEIESGLHHLLAGDLDAAGADPRHGSLPTVIGASYDGLGAPEKDVLDHLSVFGGQFTAEAATAVVGESGDTDVDRCLAGLVNRSLVAVHHDGRETRYAMLETVRAFAAERLAARGRTEAARSRHTGFFVELAKRADDGMRGSEERRWIDTLDRDLPNLGLALERLLQAGDQAALDLVGGLYWYGFVRMQPDVSAWAIRACERFADGRHPRLPAAIAVAAVGAWRGGDLARAQRLADETIRLATGSPTARLAQEVAGDVAIFHGRVEDGRAAMERAAGLSRAAGDPYQEAMDLGSAAVAAAYANEPSSRVDAHRLAERAIAVADRSDNPTARAWTTYVAGEIRLETEPATARALLRAGLDQADEVGDRFVQGVALVSLASIEARAGDPRAALEHLARVLDLWRRGGTWLQQWTTIRVLVETLTRLSRDEPAAILLGAVRSRSTATPVFGPDTERAARVRRQLEAALGAGQMEHLEAVGAAMDDQRAVDYAMASVAEPGR
jgi:predicted ATPase